MVEVFISLGSNMGDRADYLAKARKRIEKEIDPIHLKSSIYKTEAWGNSNQKDFLNQIIGIKTKESAEFLLKKLLSIEESLGRKRQEKWGARTIDLDILLYNQLIINEKDLIIPHPLMTKRRFILIPFSEISPKTLHPLLRKTIIDLSKTCLDTSNVTLYKS